MDTPLSAKRTILYYPTMSVPNGGWLRQALLYWDQIGSIVPEELQKSGDAPYNDDILFLLHEDVFRPVGPDLLFGCRDSRQRVQWLENEFRDVLYSEQFRKNLPSIRKRTAKIHSNYASMEYPRG
jgi:hypothetical protein